MTIRNEALIILVDTRATVSVLSPTRRKQPLPQSRGKIQKGKFLITL